MSLSSFFWKNPYSHVFLHFFYRFLLDSTCEMYQMLQFLTQCILMIKNMYSLLYFMMSSLDFVAFLSKILKILLLFSRFSSSYDATVCFWMDQTLFWMLSHGANNIQIELFVAFQKKWVTCSLKKSLHMTYEAQKKLFFFWMDFLIVLLVASNSCIFLLIRLVWFRIYIIWCASWWLILISFN